LIAPNPRRRTGGRGSRPRPDAQPGPGCPGREESAMIRRPRKSSDPGRGGGPAPEPAWEARTVRCPEGDHEARLLLRWGRQGRDALEGIICDNPRFAGLDNWDCEWSCWEKVEAQRNRSE